MPVRKVSNSGGNIIGYFPSLKMGKSLAYESTIERDLLYLLDFEEHIGRFEEQPLIIEYEDEGKKRTYTPDFLVTFTDGTQTLIECKPEALVDKPENQRKIKAGQAYAAREGIGFEVITDTALRAGYRLENVKLLTNYARHQFPAILLLGIQHEIREHSEKGLSISIQQFTVENLELMSALLHLAFHHHIYIPLNDAPITEQTSVSLKRPT